MLEELHGFSPTPGVTLKLHMGIGAGRLTSYTVGGHLGKWECFIAGEPIEQMSDAAEIAKAGELVLSVPALEKMRDALAADSTLRAMPADSRRASARSSHGGRHSATDHRRSS